MDARLSSITFLGTSSGCPSKTRNVSSLGVTLSTGEVILVDCGEGTQHRIQHTRLRPTRLVCICLTHLHGDHVLGLTGLVCTLSMAHDRSDPLTIIGPVGTKEFLESSLRLTHSYVSYPLEFIEVDAAHPSAPEDVQLALKRAQKPVHTLACGVEVYACPIAHTVPCLGFVLVEPQRRGNIDKKALKALGLQGRLVGQLVREGKVDVPCASKDDPAGDRTITLDQVSLPPPRPGKMTILGDTHDASLIAALARDCDMLVHESTLEQGMDDQAVEKGHSTSTMAGRFAAGIKASTMIINHFSPRYDWRKAPTPRSSLLSQPSLSSSETQAAVCDEHDKEGSPQQQTKAESVCIEDLAEQAQAVCPDTFVVAAMDLQTYDLNGKLLSAAS